MFLIYAYQCFAYKPNDEQRIIYYYSLKHAAQNSPHKNEAWLILSPAAISYAWDTQHL